jgi:pimeloyl-ACP methyl ester carboxylesterase
MHPAYKQIRNKTILIGSISVGIGFFGAILPFLPGTLFFILGLSLLSLHSKTAFRLLASLRARFPHLTHSIKLAQSKLIDFFNLTTHKREYVTIPNKNGNPLSLLVEPTYLKTGVVVLLHSASGVSETKLMETFAENFRLRGFNVVRFNAFNGLGDSGGDIGNFLTSTYREDLESVILWAQTQTWWQHPFILGGHSVGGLVAALYASEHQDEVDELVLLAPTVSGESYEKALATHEPDTLDVWKTAGARDIMHPLTKEVRRLSFDFVEDLRQFNLLNCAQKITMPTVVLSGTSDTTAPLEEGKLLCDSIGKHATLLPLTHVHHTPTTHEEIATLQESLKKMKLLSVQKNTY